MKKILSILMTLLTLSTFSQTLKTFNGAFSDGKLQNGIAVYTYYEDPETHEYLKQGSFKYTFNGKGDYVGYNQTITGNFEKGLKTGTWTYSITMSDFGSKNPYFTGTISLVSNYINGYADGNWKEVRSYKTRNKYFSYGKYIWEAFGPVKTMTINMNFKNGYIVGSVNINDEFDNFKATGNYDNNSLCIGTWFINDMGWGKNRELIYKDNYLYEFIARSNSGAVEEGTTKYQFGYDNLIKARVLTKEEREEAGLNIDTICGGTSCAATNNIQSYFPKLFSVDYFLYEFIGGDLSFKEGFKGGCDIQINKSNYSNLKSIREYIDGEYSFNTSDWLNAYKNLSEIKLNILKPSDKNIIKNKLSIVENKLDSQILDYKANELYFKEFIKNKLDTLEYNRTILTKQIPLKTFNDAYGTKVAIGQNNLPQKLNDNFNDIKFNFENPWNNENWLISKKCFEKNEGLYNIAQIIATYEYFKLFNLLNDELEKIDNYKIKLKYKDSNISFYSKDKQIFLSDIDEGEKSYKLSQDLINLQVKCIEMKDEISDLSKLHKKKNLFEKYTIVYNDMNSKLQNYSNLQTTIENAESLLIFLKNIIEIYPTDTKELEKNLKNLENSDQIKTILLGQ